AELYKDGWTNNQRIGGKLATHGRRGIDYCFVPLVQFAGKDETTDNEEQR
ncbi:MAG: hypothetical protein JWO15_3852, partial [Sphingomonadales bacterium]|nr:hypothetical protein [Sphingomonadales bacterium]